MLSNLNLVSLHGLNNLRKLQYDIDISQLSEIHQQLQTVSSSLISEVNFTYDDSVGPDHGYKDWNEIDNLVMKNFPALLRVTIEWIPFKRNQITWDDCVSHSVAALPKLHQKGILHPLLPPPFYLK